MASMGLRINSGQRPIVDASLGKTLADAFFGDTDTEIKLARLRDQEAMDEYQKRQYQAATDLNIMNTALAAAKASDAEWQLGAKKGGVGPGAKLVLAAQQGGTGYVAPGAVEQPAVVEQPPAPSLPYQSVGGAGAYPVVASDAEPVPVVEGHVATSPTAAAAAAPEQPPAPEPPVVPSIIRLPDDSAEPAPVDEVPDFAPPRMASSPDAAYLLAQRGEGWDATSGAEGNLPVVIDGDSPSAHSVASITNTSDTDTADVPDVSAAHQPVPGTAATAPASVGSAAAPTAPADANPKPAVPGTQPDANAEPVLPNTAPVPPQKPEIHPIPGTDKVVVKDGQGRVAIYNQQDAEAAVAAIIANGGDIQGGIGKLGGQLGILTDPSLPPAVKEAIVLSGGTVPGRDTILGTDEAIRLEAAKAGMTPQDYKKNLQLIKDAKGVEHPYQVGMDKNGNMTLKPVQGYASELAGMEDLVPDLPGEGENITMHNYVQEIAERKRRGLPISPAQASVYAAAYDDLYGEKVTTANGVTTEIPAQTPDGLPTPAEVGAPTSGPAPQPPAQQPPAQQPPAQQPPAQQPPAQQPPAQQPPAKVTNPNAVRVSRVNGRDIKNYGGWVGEGEEWPTVTDIVRTSGGREIKQTRSTKPKTDREVGATASRDYRLALQAIPAMKQLDDAGLSGAPGAVQNILEKMSHGGEYLPEEFANQFTDPETRIYAAAVAAFVNAQVRPDTGAAVKADEYADYARRFALRTGANAEEYKNVRKARNTAIKSMRASLIGQVPEAQLQRLDEELAAAGIDLDWNPDKKGGGGDTSNEPDFVIIDGQSVPNPNKKR